MKASVTQKDDFGCGIACVAFVSGKSYQEVICALGDKKAKEKGFYCRELTMVLSEFGEQYGYCHLKPRNRGLIYTEDAIVFLKRSKLYPSGHYIVHYNGQWMDPWINFAVNKNINNAQSGYRKRLSGEPQYVLYKVSQKPLQKRVSASTINKAKRMFNRTSGDTQ